MKSVLIGVVITGVALGITCPAIPAGAQSSVPSAAIKSGTCESPGDTLAVLNNPVAGQGEKVGSSNAARTAISVTQAPVPLEAFLDKNAVLSIEDKDGRSIGCGEIGGSLESDGALVIGLAEESGSGMTGIAYFAPAGAETSVSLFLTSPDADFADGATGLEQAAKAAIGPSPTPTLEEEIANYPVLEDVRELAIRPGAMMGDNVVFSGTIMTINVATPGKMFALGDDQPKPYSVQMQVQVSAPNGTSEVVFVGYDGETEGMFEGSWVSVYGTVVDTQTFENTLGGGVTQPLVAAKLVQQ